MVAAYEVAKPGYRPVRPRRVEVEAIIDPLLNRAGEEDCDLPAEAVDVLEAPTSLRTDDRNWFDRMFD